MTKKAAGAGCRWCRAPIGRTTRSRAARRFCRPACRQAAYRARQLAAGHGLGDGEVVVLQSALDDLADAQYELATALEDLEIDLADAETRAEVVQAATDLAAACGPLAGLRLRPVGRALIQPTAGNPRYVKLAVIPRIPLTRRPPPGSAMPSRAPGRPRGRSGRG